ncbi:MAG: hypothetical protein K8F91_03410, partial [Candidatus Obscuribacterales bacterium]|nr:hypothetical protein [Candidatus Obscuribacterales bacterium]
IKWNKNSLAGALISLALSLGLTSCGGGGTTSESNAVTPQGTMELEKLKVGVPEKVIEDAVLTFELDENPMSRVGGKHQYISRTKDKKGGKYLVQCVNGNCFETQAYYTENPITKEQAIETMKTMLPTQAPEQSRVDDSQLKDGKAEQPVEKYYFGDAFYGELVYTDKSGELVKFVNVYDIAKNKPEGDDATSKETAEKTDSESAAKPESKEAAAE